MVVPAEVRSVFNDKEFDVVFDVGGDDVGAIALGQYNRYFRDEPYDMYFVVNLNRPLTATDKGTVEFLREIETSSRLKVKSLVEGKVEGELFPIHIYMLPPWRKDSI